jgi:uncharacterized membrane protein
MQKLLSFMLALAAILIFLAPPHIDASGKHKQAIYQEATIESITPTSNFIEGMMGISTQKVVLKTQGGKTITLEESRLPKTLGDQLQKGDTVIIATSVDQNGDSITYITDYKRSMRLLILVGLFVIVITVIGRWQGLTSFIGMIISFIVIIRLIVPQILGGTNPIVAALLGGIIIIPVTFFLSHGLSKKTTIGILGTLASLLITGLLALFFVSFTRLTGFAAEESSILQLYTQGALNMRDLLLGGIIIGAMGILDDITISQTSIVERLRKANQNYSPWKLYTESMIVGRDHIASLVNTLVLVYAGASLPLFVLFVNQNLALSPVINHEVIATEIVRTVVSSIGIVLAVPITSAIASWQFRKG